MTDWIYLASGSMVAVAGVVCLIFFFRLAVGKVVAVPTAVFFMFIGLGVVVGGISIIDIRGFPDFNPEIHECTEWVGFCPEIDGLDPYFKDNLMQNCTYTTREEYDLWAHTLTPPQTKISVDITKIPEACVSFREKTECEKGNPEYVLDAKCPSSDVVNSTTMCLIKGSSPQPCQILCTSGWKEFCRLKTPEELERHYRKENPKDTGVCLCLNYGEETYNWTADIHNEKNGWVGRYEKNYGSYDEFREVRRKIKLNGEFFVNVKGLENPLACTYAIPLTEGMAFRLYNASLPAPLSKENSVVGKK